MLIFTCGHFGGGSTHVVVFSSTWARAQPHRDAAARGSVPPKLSFPRPADDVDAAAPFLAPVRDDSAVDCVCVQR